MWPQEASSEADDLQIGRGVFAVVDVQGMNFSAAGQARRFPMEQSVSKTNPTFPNLKHCLTTLPVSRGAQRNEPCACLRVLVWWKCLRLLNSRSFLSLGHFFIEG